MCSRTARPSAFSKTSSPLPPHSINYRANIRALADLGFQDIVSLNSVGSLKPDQTAKAHYADLKAEARQAWHFIPTEMVTFGRKGLPMTEMTEEQRKLAMALLQSAIDLAAYVHPATLRYTDVNDAHTIAPSFVGEQTLAQSLWTLLGERHITAHIHFATGLMAGGAHRRSLGNALREVIRAPLHSPVKAPETPSYLQDATHSTRHPTHSPYQSRKPLA